MYGLINVFATQQFLQFLMAVISFVIGLITCKELKGAQIASNCLLWVKSYANEQKCKQ